MIHQSYILLTRIPLYQGPDGKFLADRLWAKDIEQHLAYIEDFHICCPISANPPSDAIQITLRPESVHQVREDRGWGAVVCNILPNWLAVRKAVHGKHIVHGGAAGWAFPLAYYVLLLRKHFKFIMVIESSFWMATKSHTRLRTRLFEPLHTIIVKRLLKLADARIFTQQWYQDTLLGSDERSLVAPAVWIDESTVLQALPERPERPLSLIFPSRMVPEKGVDTVLAAAAAYKGAPMRLDFVGDGPLATKIKDFLRNYEGPIDMRYQPAVPYDEGFFELLRGHDAIIIAALTEEQPRIAFDAFSQGVPCIVSATHGNKAVVLDGKTGFLFTDEYSLRDMFQKLASDLNWLPKMRAAALAYARNNSIREMHRRREEFLHDVLSLENVG